MTVGLKIIFANYVGDYGEAEIEKKSFIAFWLRPARIYRYHRPTDN